jgi:hypothetical protein
LTDAAAIDYIAYGEDEGSFMARTHVVSSRLQPGQQQRLARKAKQLGRTPSEIGALLIEEGLRRDEFAFIDFRDSPVGRQACLQNSTLAVWEVVWIARGYHDNVPKTAEHFRMAPLEVLILIMLLILIAFFHHLFNQAAPRSKQPRDGGRLVFTSIGKSGIEAGQ